MASPSATLTRTPAIIAPAGKSARPSSLDGGLSRSGGNRMRCADCEGCVTVSHGDGVDHAECSYTGVTVQTDDWPECASEHDKAALWSTDESYRFCARKLTPLTRSEVGRKLARDILRGIRKRGKLPALLATYERPDAQALAELVGVELE